MGTIDHRAVAIRFFAAAPSLLDLGLSLHGDGKMDFWVPDSAGMAQKCDPSIAMRKYRLSRVGTTRLTSHVCLFQMIHHPFEGDLLCEERVCRALAAAQIVGSVYKYTYTQHEKMPEC